MSKRLLLMRHAASLPLTSGRDFDRNLSEIGKEQVTRMAIFLEETKWVPDYALVSTARRAQQTLQILSDIVAIGKDKTTFLESLYYASVGQIEELIRHAGITEQTQTLLILAHNPSISQLATTCSNLDRVFYFSPAAIAGFDIDVKVDWEQFSSEYTHLSFFKEAT